MYAADVNITRDTCIYVTRKYLAGVISRKVIQERHLKGKSELFGYKNEKDKIN